MKNYLRTILIVSLLGASSVHSHADRYATLVEGQSLTLAEGETALVIFVSNSSITQINPIIEYTPAGAETAVPIQLLSSDSNGDSPLYGAPSELTPLPLVGPAVISVNPLTITNKRVLGLKIVSTEIPTSGETSVLPSNTVVIPADAEGPVDIVLESSEDLVNWIAALPGTYGATLTNRFFRVRAANQ